jgi:autotransporter-associated beta strand protein
MEPIPANHSNQSAWRCSSTGLKEAKQWRGPRRVSPIPQTLARFILKLTCTLVVLIAGLSSAASLQWDGNGAAPPNPNGGNGTWDSNKTANWWTGSAHVAWPSPGGLDDDAVFGNTLGSIAIAEGGVTANDLVFSLVGTYTLSGGPLTLNGTAPTVTVSVAGATPNITSVIQGSAGLKVRSLSTSGTRLTLGGNNTYTGQTDIHLPESANTLFVTVSHPNGLGATGVGNETILNGQNASSGGSRLELANVVTNPGETLVFRGAANRRANLQINSTFTSGTWQGPVRLEGQGICSFGVADNRTLTVSGNLSVASGAAPRFQLVGAGGPGFLSGNINLGTHGLFKYDTGIWRIGSTGNVWGNTEIFGGTLVTDLANALPSGSGLIFQNTTGTTTLDLNGLNQTIDSLTKTTGGSAVVTSAAPATLVLIGNTSTEFNGSLTGSISLEKHGTGILTLSGDSSHTGTTRILEGALDLSGAITGNSSFELAESATLFASGTIRGPVTLEGTLSVDAGSTLGVDGSLTLGPASRTEVGFYRSGSLVTSSRIQVSGTLTLGGALVVSNTGTKPLEAGDVVLLFNASSTVGSFSSVSLPPGCALDPAQLAQGKVVIATTAPPPGFDGFSVQDGIISLTWPPYYKGWFVQSNAVDLQPQNWLDIVGSDAVTSLSLPMDPANQREFFRLRRPYALDFPDDPLAKGAALDVGHVWTGITTPFRLLTTANLQIAAYYDATRRLIIAARNLDSTKWHYQSTVETFAGWDGHNYITMCIDPLGYLHVSADMHVMPMNYFRSLQPVTGADQFGNPGFIQKLNSLWDPAFELKCTYPNFISGPGGEFGFNYRSQYNNTSGTWHVLKYDTATRSYFQATGTSALFSWTGNYSVYPAFTTHGQHIHCVYVWRGSTDASSNYRLSYIRSADLTNWTDAFGRALTLPVGPATSFATIDDIPKLGGLLNNQPRISFDRDGIPIVAYHKYDSAGKSQVYVARPDPVTLTWKIIQLTDSNMTWNFSGSGSLPPGGSVGNTFVADDPVDGLLTLDTSFTDGLGTVDPTGGYYTLDETSLANLPGIRPNSQSYASPNTPEANSGFVDPNIVENPYITPVTGVPMGIRRSSSHGVDYAGLHYYLRWESLPSDNRDQPKKDASGNVISPTPSMLRLYRTQAEFGNSLTDDSGTFYGRMFKPDAAVLSGAMTRENDTGQPFGAVLTSPVSGTENFAQWTFSVPGGGDYALGASALATSPSDGGFHIQIDGGPLIEWRPTGRWNYQPVTSGSARGMARFELTPGPHVLRLYAAGPGAKLSYLWLDRPSIEKTPSLQPVEHSGFDLVADDKAVCGYSLRSAAGGNPSGFTAHYQIPVPQSGNYLLLGRTRALDGQSNSFHLSVNNAASEPWHLPVSGPDWVWSAIGGTRSLASSTLDIDVAGREAGSELDSFMLLRVP